MLTPYHTLSWPEPSCEKSVDSFMVFSFLNYNLFLFLKILLAFHFQPHFVIVCLKKSLTCIFWWPMTFLNLDMQISPYIWEKFSPSFPYKSPILWWLFLFEVIQYITYTSILPFFFLVLLLLGQFPSSYPLIHRF